MSFFSKEIKKKESRSKNFNLDTSRDIEEVFCQNQL